MHDTAKFAQLVCDAVKRNLVQGKHVVVRFKGNGSRRAAEILENFNQGYEGEKLIHSVSDYTEACNLAVELSRKD